jgi:hypothetical protein
MNYPSHADQCRKLAEYYCGKGLHDAAASEFLMALLAYEALGDWYMVAYCEGAANAELRQIRPSAPVNISALVD